MDLTAATIVLALALAAMFAWVVLDFVSYKRYFKAVYQHMAKNQLGSINVLPPEVLSRLDYVVRRCYFQKQSINEAVIAVLDFVKDQSNSDK